MKIAEHTIGPFEGDDRYPPHRAFTRLVRAHLKRGYISVTIIDNDTDEEKGTIVYTLEEAEAYSDALYDAMRAVQVSNEL